jgi:hypothetical protein
MKKLVQVLTLLIAALACACTANVEPHTPAPECAWVDETYACPAELFSREVERLDSDETTCLIYTYHCGDPVDACKREVYTCQPNVVLGGPSPGSPREE